MITQDRLRQDAPKYARFAISQRHAERMGAALPLMIADRLGYMDRQHLEDPVTPTSDIRPLIDLIVSSSSQQTDYLLPDTPLKEALFRLILAGGNEPVTAVELSETLSARWAMSAYPRDLSPYVINRLLETGANYCIVRVDEGEEG